MDKDTLHHKISKLQLKVLDFQHRISPRKKKSLESQDQVGTACHLAKSIKLVSEVKMAIFLLCPFIFPAFVYCLDGNCPLFWQATAGSTFLMALMAFVYLSCKLKDTMHDVLSGVQSNVKIVVHKTDYLGSKRKFQFASLIMLLFLISSFSYWAVLNDMPILFNTCLVMGGFVGGILCVNVYAFWQEPKQLPYLSPMAHDKKDKMNGQAKRELKFCDSGIKRSPSPTHNYTTAKKGSVLTEFQGLVPLPIS